MTVGELIAALEKEPRHLPVQIVYDSAVCSCDIKLVAQWFPQAGWRGDDKGANVVGLFEDSSARETHDPEDERWPRRAGLELPARGKSR